MTSAPCSRRLLLLATGAWAAWPHAVFAQGARPYRVALVFTTTPVADMVGDRPVRS